MDFKWDPELLESVRKVYPNKLAYEICGVMRLKANSNNTIITEWLRKARNA